MASSTILPAPSTARKSAGTETAHLDDEYARRREHRSNYAWLLPWLIASIGFLTTLALLR